MEVKPGYKQTEVGVIPIEWEAKALGDVITHCFSGATPRRNRPDYFKGDIRWITSGELNYNIITDTIEKITHEAVVRANLTIIPKGTFLMAITGLEAEKTRGSCGIVGMPSTTNQSCMAVFPTADLVTDYLFYYYVLHGKSLALKYCQGTKQQSYTAKLVKQLPIALPPTTIEQSAIAEALSDVDALLAGLDRLIAKKRDLKQAAMQQLLTGQTRLPGFHDAWQVKRFGDLTTLRKEKIDPRHKGVQDVCVELEHIEPATGKLLGTTSTSINSSLKSVFYEGDILFGKLRAYLRKYWLASFSGVCSTEIWVFVPNGRLVTAAYLFQIVKVDRFIEVASSAYGTHMPRSDWGVVKNINLRLPTIPEQTAITEVLMEMDAELTTLTRQQEKTRALKQAMMQELLTGRIRLV
jgi:type I restriction enzyme S subunit